MKKSYLLVVLFLSLFFIRCTDDKRPRTIERPVYGLQNTKTLEIDKVVLTDTSTILHIDAYFPSGMWIRIDSATYIQAEGKKYILESAENIVINELHWMPENGEDHFKLTFPPLPKGTKSFDFIESDCADCFKIWDVDLTGKTKEYKPQLPPEIVNYQEDKSLTLQKPEFRTGRTKVTLLLSGMKDGYVINNISLLYNNIFTFDHESIDGVKESDNKYVFEVDMNLTSLVRIRIDNDLINFYLNPGEEAEVYYDMTAYSKSASRYNPQPDLVYAGFKGDFSELNTQLQRNREVIDSKTYNVGAMEDKRMLEMIKDQYFDHLLKSYSLTTDSVDNSDLSQAVKDIIKINMRRNLAYTILNIGQVYEYAYRSEHNRWDNNPIDVELPAITSDDYDILKRLNLNDTLLVYSSDYLNIIASLINSRNVPSADALNDITQSPAGLMQDFKKAIPITSKAYSMEELSGEEKQILSSLPRYYQDVYSFISENTKRKYDEAMAKGGFVIYPTPDVRGDQILEKIIAQHKGKTVFVDFWATWCGPCLNAMKTIKPMKLEMKDMGVVSIYISNDSSPRAKWLSMLPDIGGFHYYLDNEQWRGLSDKYSIRGIPTYMIFDKSGKKSFESTGYPGNEKIKEELQKAL